MDSIGIDLKQMGMTKKAFANKLGLAPVTVYAWKTLPSYAVAYIKLMDEYSDYKIHIKELMEKL